MLQDKRLYEKRRGYTRREEVIREDTKREVVIREEKGHYFLRRNRDVSCTTIDWLIAVDVVVLAV